MAKQLTAPGCIYSIVARVDTTIYSPDQNWVLDVPAGQHDFIAETNEIIIPADAMMRRKTRQHAKDRNRINLLGIGPGSLVGFITRAIERIVGKGNVTVTYEDGKMTVVLAQNVTYAQVAMVENLLERMLPKDVVEEISDAPMGYTRLYFLESTGVQRIDTGVKLSNASEVRCVLETQDLDGLQRRTPYGFAGNTSTQFYCFSQFVESPNSGSKSVFYLPNNYIFTENRIVGNCSITHNKHGITINGITTPARNEVTEYFETGSGCHLFIAANTSAYFIGRIFTFSISRNSRLQCDYIPTLDPAGKPCMFDLVRRQAFYNAAPTGSDFIAGMTTAQALNLANLPITGDGALTVSLPWEDQWDAGVQNALDTASTNGWTITVQYRDPDVGAENIPISFLESTGTQYIDTGIKLSNESEVRCDVMITQTRPNGNAQAFFGVFGAPTFRGYVSQPNTVLYINAGVNQTDMIAAFAGTKIEEKWEIHITKTKTILNNSQSETYELATFETSNTCYIFAANTLSENYWSYARVYAFSIARNNRSQLNFIPALDRTGRPCMFDAVTGKLFYNAATTGPDFIAGMTWEQVRNLQLPTTGGQLTLSLPYEASIDGLAQAALEQARANGWVLTLQYDEAEVPEGYSKLDFLESTGVQYIDTETKLTNASEVVCEFMETAKTPNTSALYGNETSKEARFSAFLKIGLSGTTSRWDFASEMVAYRTPLDLKTKYNSVHNAKGVTLDGKEIVAFAAAASFETGNLGLFTHSVAYGGYYANARIYTFNISRNNSLQLAYIPCLDSEGVPCMFDLVSHQSFRNKGTGQFIAGMTLEQVRGLSLPAGGGQLTLSLPYEASIDKQAQTALEQARENGWELTLQYAEMPAGYTRLDYLESNGTQWIDTGFVATKNTGLYAEWMFNGQGENHQNQHVLSCMNMYCARPRIVDNIWVAQGVLGVTNSSNFELTLGKKNISSTNFQNSKTISFNETSVKVDEVVGSVQEEVILYGYSDLNTSYLFYGRVYSAKISEGTELVRDFIPCLDDKGEPCMLDTVSKQTFRNEGEGAFIAGLATIEDVRNLWLPETGGELTISVPADTPDSAVDQLRTNNPTWQIAIQYRTDNEN